MVANPEPILTIADLDAMPDDGNRYEIIEGELFVSCAPSLTHQDIVANLMFFFQRYLRNNPIGKVLPGPGVIFSNFSGVIPDAVYISNERRADIAAGAKVTGAPDLIIEILSPGAENQRLDRHFKRQLYRKYGVKEYWVIDPDKVIIEIYRTSKLRLIKSLGIDDEVTSPLLPGFLYSVREMLRLI
jgi:Uma2 family endonuclease